MKAGRSGLRWVADRRRWGATMAATALLGALWIARSAVPAAAVTGGRIPSPREGFLAPDFTVELADGGTFTLSEARGGPVVVNVWASWCPPCRAEMPALQAVWEDVAPSGVMVLALNATRQDTPAAARRFAERFGLTLPIGFDVSGEVERLYQVRALPTTFFIDAEGVIRRVVVGGPLSEASLRAEVEALLGAEPQ